ncbi:MAG: deoxyuridine 5'-triphosphate nucleotidohydrolase [Clostridia bacterium]
MSVAKFSLVSRLQFSKDGGKNYDNLIIPRRATTNSAGYDFFASCDIVLGKNQKVFVPSGIRVKLKSNYMLLLLPKSGLGAKFDLKLANTVGLIDADYFNADNQGHIIVALCNGEQELTIKQGQAFVQGVIVRYYKAQESNVKTKRKGGFGSTQKS